MIWIIAHIEAMEDMELSPIVTELSLRGRKLNISIASIFNITFLI